MRSTARIDGSVILKPFAQLDAHPDAQLFMFLLWLIAIGVSGQRGSVSFFGVYQGNVVKANVTARAKRVFLDFMIVSISFS